MGKYFGTDGIRGVANQGLDALLAFKAGQAAAFVLAEAEKRRPVITIGKDTRISSDMLEAALVAGLCSAGADVVPLGVVPTPAVAYITVAMGADAGIVISASHNPYEHNGIKIFNSEGYKLPDELELAIEEHIDSAVPVELKTHDGIGRVLHDGGRGVEAYKKHILSMAAPELGGLRVVIDCANGASSATAPDIFSKLPIDVTFISHSPDGVNINAHCGSTHLEGLRDAVKEGGYDVGLAFDGDADRCLVVDENGKTIDGDKMMAVVGRYMKAHGQLKNNTIVATVMSNLGFHEYTEKNGMTLLSAPVGDRNVLEMMQRGGHNLGGEQSGHIIFLDDATTGDGQLAAVKFLNLLSSCGKKASELVGEIPRYPQVLLNVAIEGGNAAKKAIMESSALQEAVASEEKLLDGNGRILIRPSGTEALIRVMTEAKSREIAESAAARLTELIRSL